VRNVRAEPVVVPTEAPVDEALDTVADEPVLAANRGCEEPAIRAVFGKV
jgi:hypothetical protein